MGSIDGRICGTCGERFMVRDGGGFFFDVLHCDECGRPSSVSHEKLGDIHLRFVKGLRTPYAIARAGFDRAIQAGDPGEPLTREAYHAAAEATLGRCDCGGTFANDAPSRCPGCRSTSESWTDDPDAPAIFVD
jgi:hypothetical protein